MEDVFYFNELYDLYGELLTEKQREYFEGYYFNNLSFAELAEKYEVSRNAIFKQIQIVRNKLLEYEKILELYDKNNKLLKIIDEIKDEKLIEKLERLL